MKVKFNHKKEVLKILEASKITNFQTPEDQIIEDIEKDKKAKKEKQHLTGISISLKNNQKYYPKVMNPEQEDNNAGIVRDEQGNVKSEATK
jgi:hypothetical protein